MKRRGIYCDVGDLRRNCYRVTTDQPHSCVILVAVPRISEDKKANKKANMSRSRWTIRVIA